MTSTWILEKLTCGRKWAAGRDGSIQPPAKVLIIGMADSIHLARWLSQFEHSHIEFRLVSSSPHRKLHQNIMELLKRPEGSMSISISLASKYLSLPLWALDRLFSDFFRGLLIAAEIRRFRPTFLHVNEIQNAGYATLKALKILRFRRLPPIFLTNYGSELVWYGQYPRHQIKLKELLMHSSAFSAECRRDYLLAEKLGFAGVKMPQMPVAGGARFQGDWSSARRTIAVKGYHNKWGRALTVLECINDMRDELQNFRVEVFSSNRLVLRKIKKLRKTTNLKIVGYGKGKLSHEEMMQLFSRSLCYIGFSLSDGISTSMIEAMANGAIPIQTSTSCAEEWIEHEKTGFILAPTDDDGLKSALRKIIAGGFNQLAAQMTNIQVIKQKYDPEILQNVAKSQYQIMLNLSKC